MRPFLSLTTVLQRNRKSMSNYIFYYLYRLLHRPMSLYRFINVIYKLLLSNNIGKLIIILTSMVILDPIHQGFQPLYLDPCHDEPLSYNQPLLIGMAYGINVIIIFGNEMCQAFRSRQKIRCNTVSLMIGIQTYPRKKLNNSGGDSQPLLI